MEENQESPGSHLLLRCASQNSLDESSQRPTQIAPPQPLMHAVKALDALNQMRKQGLLCDITLIAGDAEIVAHRALLASISPYFRGMFTHFDERSKDTVTIQNVEPLALGLLVDYMYDPESLEVTEDNVQILLPAANLLQVMEVREKCCAFLYTQLHATNALGIRAFADLHACSQLAHEAQMFIEAHFTEIVESEEFFTLTNQQLAKLLASDRLTVPSEEKILEAVIAWVNFEPEDRRQYLAELMNHVRLPLLPQDCLVGRVQSEPLFSGDMRCKDLLIEALAFHLMRPEQRAVAVANCPRAKPRQPQGAPKVLMVIGGQAPKAIRNVECYDLEEGKWYNTGDMLTRRCRAGVGVVEGKVYAVGGFNGTLRVRTVDVYDPITGQWSPGPSMDARRSTLGVAVIAPCLYAVGGFDGTTGLSSAEVLDTRTGAWRAIASMSTRRSSVGVAVLHGKIYAVGGYDGASRQCLSSVECYDPETDAWTSLPDMSARRSGAGVGVLDGILYAVGGHDGPAVRRSVESWDFFSGVWKEVASMSAARRNAGVTVHNGRLIAVGGDDGSTNLATAEQYDPETNTWTILPRPMVLGRSYAGVAVLDRAGRVPTRATSEHGPMARQTALWCSSSPLTHHQTAMPPHEPATPQQDAAQPSTSNNNAAVCQPSCSRPITGSPFAMTMRRMQSNSSPSSSQTVEFNSRPSTNENYQYTYATIHELPPRIYTAYQDAPQRLYATLNEVYDLPHRLYARRPCPGRHFTLCTRGRVQWILVRSCNGDTGAAECDGGGWPSQTFNSRAEGDGSDSESESNEDGQHSTAEQNNNNNNVHE